MKRVLMLILLIVYCPICICAHADEFEGTPFGEPEPETIITEAGMVLDGNYEKRNFIDYADGYFIVKYEYGNESRYGIIDICGNTIVEPDLKGCSLFIEGLARFRNADDEIGYLDVNGNVVFNLDDDQVYQMHYFSERLGLVEFNDGWGYIDETGKTVIPPMHYLPYWIEDYRDVVAQLSFSDGLAVTWDEYDSRKFGYIDKNGELVIPCIYDDAQAFNDGAAYVILDGKTGVIDTNGDYLIPCEYDEVEYANGVAIVEKDGQEGIVDTEGNWLCEPGIYEFEWDDYILEHSSFADGYAVIVKDDKFGVIGKQGNVLIEPQYEYASFLGDGVFFVLNEGRCAYFDIEAPEDIVWTFTESGYGFGIWGAGEEAVLADGYYMIREEDKYGVVDLSGNIIIEPVCDREIEYSDGLFAVRIDGKAGYMDAEGNVVIDLVFDRTYAFYGGIAAVERGGLGFIDGEGNLITELKWMIDDDEYGWMYDWCEGAEYYEHNGISAYVVRDGNTEYLIDTEGNILY